jgi:hypothetical protein
MSLYKLELTETPNGKADRAHSGDRRRQARLRAGAFETPIAVISITDIPGFYNVYEWIVDDPTDLNVYALVNIFNFFGFVSCPGPVRVFTEEESYTTQELFVKISSLDFHAP